MAFSISPSKKRVKGFSHGFSHGFNYVGEFRYNKLLTGVGNYGHKREQDLVYHAIRRGGCTCSAGVPGAILTLFEEKGSEMPQTIRR